MPFSLYFYKIELTVFVHVCVCVWKHSQSLLNFHIFSNKRIKQNKKIKKIAFLEESTTQGIYDGMASPEKEIQSQNLPVCVSSRSYKGEPPCLANKGFQICLAGMFFQ